MSPLCWYRRIRAKAAVSAGRHAAGARAWSDAAAHYRIALSLDPAQMGIWVQLGHALKEQGDLAGAEEAYRRALAFEGAVADTYIQLGHLMKLQRRYADAARAYVTAVEREPNSLPAREALLAFVGYSSAEMGRAITRWRAPIAETARDTEWQPTTEHAPSPYLAAVERRDSYDVIWLGPIDWNFRIQRPQHLAMQIADGGARIFYISTVFEPANREGRFRIIDHPYPGVMEVRLGINGDPFESIHVGLSKPGIAELQRSLAALTAAAAISAPIVIVQHPGWSRIALTLPRAAVIYDCLDLATGFPDAPPSLGTAEAALIDGANFLITASHPLAEYLAPRRTSVVIRNGAEVEFFAEAYTERLPGLQPVIGYFGAISEWFDMKLVETCAKAKPNWEFRLIGRPDGPHSARVGKIRNIRFYGELPYRQIPQQLLCFDVAIIPFRMLDVVKYTNPVKLYEYMAAGKAVVSTPLPEVVAATNLVYIADDAASFAQRIAQALAEDTLTLRAQRRAWARQHSWANRAVQLREAIDAASGRCA